jgi:hypothetical protein
MEINLVFFCHSIDKLKYEKRVVNNKKKKRVQNNNNAIYRLITQKYKSYNVQYATHTRFMLCNYYQKQNFKLNTYGVFFQEH